MPRLTSPWSARARELLADGLWRDEEWLWRQLTPLVPPGLAIRSTEKDRQRQAPPGSSRMKLREDSYLIRMGARSIVRESVLGLTRIERRTNEQGQRVLRQVPLASGAQSD